MSENATGSGDKGNGRDDLIGRPYRPRSGSGVFALMLAVLVVATAVRFHNLGAQSFWNDEGISYVQSTRTLPDIVTNSARDIHPPLYYALLAGWRLLVGESEFALRALSTLFSLLSIAMTYALGKRLYGSVAGLVAAAFVALNTFSIYYAQELRMYSLLALIAAASLWVFVGMFSLPHPPTPFPNMERGRNGDTRPYRNILLWGVLNAAGLYTQYSYPLVMVAQGVLFLVWLVAGLRPLIPKIGTQDGRSMLRAYILPPALVFILANVLTLILYLPWLNIAWTQVTAQPNISPVTSTGDTLAAMLGSFSFGVTYAYSPPSPAVWFFLLFGLLFLSDAALHRWRALVPVAWVLVGVGAFLALNLYLRYLRFLLPVQLGFALWLGRGVWVLWTANIQPLSRTVGLSPLSKPRISPETRRRILRLAAVVGTVALLIGQAEGLDALYNASAFQRDNYRGIVSAITADPRPGDAVILDAPNQAEVFGYYFNRVDAGAQQAAPVRTDVYSLPGGDDNQTLATVRDIITRHPRIFAVFWGQAERDPNNIVEGTLNNEAFQASDEWYGDVRLVRYAAPVTFGTMSESGAHFGDAITLKRFGISGDTLKAGDVLQVRLEWQTAARLHIRYKVFVQLLKPDGTLAVQHDGEPGGGQRLSTDWQPGDTIIDNHALTLPDTLPPAHYKLIIGLYDMNNPQARLPVGGQDFLALGDIAISE